jgi:hypothetical protein
MLEVAVNGCLTRGSPPVMFFEFVYTRLLAAAGQASGARDVLTWVYVGGHFRMKCVHFGVHYQ